MDILPIQFFLPSEKCMSLPTLSDGMDILPIQTLLPSDNLFLRIVDPYGCLKQIMLLLVSQITSLERKTLGK